MITEWWYRSYFESLSEYFNYYRPEWRLVPINPISLIDDVAGQIK